jgi:hypothetical protein
METPERIYIEEPFTPNQSVFFGYPKKDNCCIEYIRSDIAEQMAKDFKCFKEEFMKYSVEDEFTEFLTSRRAQK